VEIKHHHWTIRRITVNDIAPALEFIVPMLHEIYPNIPDVAERWDLANMEEAYIVPEHSAMLAAFDDTGKVAATVAIRPYDDRLALVKDCYEVPATAELSRCYVATRLRRRKIAGQLVAAIENYCRQYGYKTICLHTHKFLPGGFPFWLSQNYIVRCQSNDDLETVYMDKSL